MRRLGFTMIELVFVIVIMGIIGKFGVEFLAQAYKSFIFSSVNHSLQAKGEVAVESIASRLQYRIKDSIIARNSSTIANYTALNSAVGNTYYILEWVGTDIDGFRGDSLPHWSGIIDLDASKLLGVKTLVSPETNTSSLSTLISVLSNGNSDINNSAIYFVGSNTNIDNYGWDGLGISEQTAVMHPIRSSANPGEENFLISTNGNTGNDNNFSGVDVYEYYQLAWTAYAVEHNETSGDLTLHYDYQPWEGESYNDANKSVLLMENVSTFRYKAIGSIVKIQVCVKDDIINGDSSGGYSLCKEKTVF